MKQIPNETDNGTTIICAAGNQLADVPESHQYLVTPMIRKVFVDPQKYFRKAADRCRFRKMAEWLRTVTEPDQWELHLFRPDYGDQYGRAGFSWVAEDVRSAIIGVPEDVDLASCPPEIRHYYSLIGFVNFMGFGYAGALCGPSDFDSLAMYPRTVNPVLDHATAHVWGGSLCGDLLFFTDDRRGGWYLHESRVIQVIGSISQTINWVYAQLLAGRAPDYERTKPRPKKKRETVQRWGYIDRDGLVAIPFQFDNCEQFHNGLANVRTQEKLEGCIDQRGQWVLPPSSLRLGSFEDGCWRVKRDGKWGVIDRAGAFVIQPTFDFLWSFSTEGLARAEMGDQTGYVDRSGKWVIAPRFRFAEDFREGLALVQDPDGQDGKWFIDTSGRLVYGPFQGARCFSEGWASVIDDQGGRFIDTRGKTVLRLPDRMQARMFREGLASAEDLTNCVDPQDPIPQGYINRQGRRVIEPQFDFAGFFRNGYAVVESNGKHGLIDKSGRFVLNPEYDTLDDPYEGRVKFGRLGHQGYLDMSGGVVIEPVYYAAQRFSEGLAAVCMEV